MKPKTFYLQFLGVFLFVIASHVSYSQNALNWEWAKRIVGTGKNFPYSMKAGSQGYIYVAGGFEDTLKLGNTQLVSKGSFDIYLLKYDANGVLVWAKQAGGADSDEAYALTLDRTGNIYLTGYFSGLANFGSVQVKSNGDRDFFVAKYDKNGEPVWIRQGGSISEDYGNAMATDEAGNVFISGIYRDKITVGNITYHSKGDKDIFLIKYDSDGSVLWSTTGGGSMADETTSMVIDEKGNCYIAGDFEGLAEFNKKMIESLGKKDVFIAKYDNDGHIQWLNRAGSATGDDHVSSIATDFSGNVYITGYFSGLANFGALELKNKSSHDMFLVKYDSGGREIWARQTEGKGDEHARSLKLDKEGNIYITGEFNVDFTFGSDNIKQLGDWDIFILKYSNSGEMLRGSQIGGIGYDKAYCIELDDLSNIIITGYFSKKITIGTTILSSTDADDGFIAKLKSF